MSYPILWTVLAVVISVISASIDVRFGVDPAFHDVYSKSIITCQGKGAIPISRVNDDYCDCPEQGEDEPGTSACAIGTFFCKNIGSKPVRIESWRVNDGICDCCDGSDEYLGLKSCPSTCENEGKALRERLKNLASTIKTGLDEKQKLVRSGESMKDNQTRRLAELQSLVGTKKTEVDNLRQQVEVAEAAAKAEKENQEAQKTEPEDESMKDSGTDTQDSHSVPADQDKVPDSKSPSSSFPYPEQYAYTGGSSDENTISESSFPYPEQYAPHNQHAETKSEVEGETEEEEAEDVHEDESPSEPVETDPHEQGMLGALLAKLPSFLDDMLAKLPPFVVKFFKRIPKNPAEAAKEARNAFQSVQNELTSYEKEIEDINRMLSIDYGPSDAYRALQSECFTMTQDKYTYKLCPFKEASQIDSHSTSLGTFQSWGNDNSEWLFDHGQRCWNGPERSVKVKLICGLRNQIISVTEPSICLYEMQFETPAACSQSEVEKLNLELAELSQSEHVRDEL